jgi:hypothetical protein
VTSGGWGSGQREDVEAGVKAEGDGLVAGDGPAVWDGVSPAAGVGTPGVGDEEVDGLQARAASKVTTVAAMTPAERLLFTRPLLPSHFPNPGLGLTWCTRLIC